MDGSKVIPPKVGSIWNTIPSRFSKSIETVAMAERDEAMHYLLNKLKSEDGWSGSNLAWNEDKLALISGQFSSFDSSAKVKVLLSFIGMTPRTISQVNEESGTCHVRIGMRHGG